MRASCSENISTAIPATLLASLGPAVRLSLGAVNPRNQDLIADLRGSIEPFLTHTGLNGPPRWTASI